MPADPVPDALRDRMEIIPLEGYTEQEKIVIAFRYLIPRQTTENGLEPETDIVFHDDAVRFLVRRYTREAGVEKHLGAPRFRTAAEVAERTRRPGVAVGLAWT